MSPRKPHWIDAVPGLTHDERSKIRRGRRMPGLAKLLRWSERVRIVIDKRKVRIEQYTPTSPVHLTRNSSALCGVPLAGNLRTEDLGKATCPDCLFAAGRREG